MLMLWYKQGYRQIGVDSRRPLTIPQSDNGWVVTQQWSVSVSALPAILDQLVIFLSP